MAEEIEITMKNFNNIFSRFILLFIHLFILIQNSYVIQSQEPM